MHHKVLCFESILLVRQVQRVEPLIQGVVESVVQRPQQRNDTWSCCSGQYDMTPRHRCPPLMIKLCVCVREMVYAEDTLFKYYQSKRTEESSIHGNTILMFPPFCQSSLFAVVVCIWKISGTGCEDTVVCGWGRSKSNVSFSSSYDASDSCVQVRWLTSVSMSFVELYDNVLIPAADLTSALPFPPKCKSLYSSQDSYLCAVR